MAKRSSQVRELDRRSFLKGTAAAGTVLAAAGFGGIAPAAQAAPAAGGQSGEPAPDGGKDLMAGWLAV